MPETKSKSRWWRSVVGLAAVATLAAACSSKGGGPTTTTAGSPAGASSTTAPSSGGSSPSSSSGGSGSSGTNKASAPGITATTITLGATEPLTGPAAPGYSEVAPGSVAVFDYVNAHGGVYGRKIKDIVENDQYNPSITATKTRKLILQDNVFALFDPLGTPTDSAVQPFVNAQKVPQLFIASGCACWNKPKKFPWSFGWQIDYIDEGKILGQYIKSHYKGQKVGYLYQNDEFGQDGVKGVDMQVPKSDVVSRQTYDTTTLSAGLNNQMSALKAAGAKVVVLYTIPAATALAMLGAAEIGYHPQYVISDVGADPPTVGGLLKSFSKGKAGPSLLNGAVTLGFLPSESNASNAWIKLFKGKIWPKYDSKNPWDGNTEYGMAVAWTMVNLLKAAGRNPTRASLVKTLEAKGSSFKGPGLVPLSYSSSNHYGFEGGRIGTVTNGGITLSGPVYITTNAGPIKTYSGTPATPPASFGS